MEDGDCLAEEHWGLGRAWSALDWVVLDVLGEVWLLGTKRIGLEVGSLSEVRDGGALSGDEENGDG